MNQIIRAFRRLPKKGEYNALKITSLAIGLAVALVVLSKSVFENSYDNFFGDSERIYRLDMSYHSSDKDQWNTHSSTPGAYAYVAQRDLQSVVAGTRFTDFGSSKIATQNDIILNASCILVDSSFFKVFDCEIISGDPIATLSTPGMIMITDIMASKLEGDPIGQTLEVKSIGEKLVIGGVYKAIPKNSHLAHLDVLLALPTMKLFSYDGSMNWLGNDRYKSYVKLAPNASVEQTEIELRRMLENNVDMDYLKKADLEIQPRLSPLESLHSGTSSVKMMTRMLIIIAIVVLFAAVLNYVLITISSLVERSREVALHRCYGATNGKIHLMSITESLIHIALALAIAVVILFMGREIIEDIMSISLTELFRIEYCWPLILVCFGVWLFSALLPGSIFSRVPVTAVFRAVSDNKRKWKMSLLFIQFTISSFLVMMLWVVSSQYSVMINDNVGYNYKNIVYTSLVAVNSNSERQRIANEIAQMPEVMAVTACSDGLPFDGASGNNVKNGDEDLFNYGDLYEVNPNFFEVMEVPINEGRVFAANGEVMVSQRFVDEMRKLKVWSDTESIGQMVTMTEQEGQQIVCGVYGDIRVGNLEHYDTRPSIMRYKKDYMGNVLLIKLRESSAESFAAVSDKLRELSPESLLDLYVYGQSLELTYIEWRNFRSLVFLGSFIALLITILGLIGYINNEINRRKKEMAIRKINGATNRDIVLIFARQTLVIASIAFAIGIVGAIVVGTRWQEQFAEKAEVSWYTGAGIIVILLSLIFAIILLKCKNIDNNNPVKYLKN